MKNIQLKSHKNQCLMLYENEEALKRYKSVSKSNKTLIWMWYPTYIYMGYMGNSKSNREMHQIYILVKI